MRPGKLQNKCFISFLVLPLLFMLAMIAACRSSNTNVQNAAGIVVVSAPATGEVRRVLVSEGAQIDQGAVIIEIAVRQETSDASPQVEDPHARARAAAQSAQSQLAAARAEAERASVEVERMTALVASNRAPQPQLDAARVQYQRAQEQLQKAQRGGSNSTIIVPQQTSAATVNAATTRERIIEARATTSGTVSVISAHVGELVTAGQPLATIRTN